MFDRLEALAQRLEELNRALMDPSVLSSATKMRDIGREHAHLTEVLAGWDLYKAAEQGIADAKELYAESDDAEMRELAKMELNELEEELPVLREKLRLLLLPKDPYEGRPILLEIRAGTGGDEAGLFAADLYRMYQRFGERQGLKFSVLSSSSINAGGGSGGFKEIIASVTGESAYSRLRFESGVHRVQRVPATESQGRIHTSAATVAVLPEPDEVEVKIQAQDLRIDTMRAGGPGGQSVNTTDSAVRIVHIPTGLTVQCQDEKSQLKNKDKAMRVLKARLLEKMQGESHAKEAAARKAQIGSGDRSERIRTYNFPQGRLTDHRIGLTLYKLDQIMNGDLQEVTDALMAAHQAELLEDLGE